MKILVTGAAGFIGSYVVEHLVKRGDEVIGLDNINSYYDIRLKLERLEDLGIDADEIRENVLIRSRNYPNFQFVKTNIENPGYLFRLFEEQMFDKVCHLAAQAGVRYSIEAPLTYVNTNVVGFLHILECCKNIRYSI